MIFPSFFSVSNHPEKSLCLESGSLTIHSQDESTSVEPAEWTDQHPAIPAVLMCARTLGFWSIITQNIQMCAHYPHFADYIASPFLGWWLSQFWPKNSVVGDVILGNPWPNIPHFPRLPILLEARHLFIGSLLRVSDLWTAPGGPLMAHSRVSVASWLWWKLTTLRIKNLHANMKRLVCCIGWYHIQKQNLGLHKNHKLSIEVILEKTWVTNHQVSHSGCTFAVEQVSCCDFLAA